MREINSFVFATKITDVNAHKNKRDALKTHSCSITDNKAFEKPILGKTSKIFRAEYNDRKLQSVL